MIRAHLHQPMPMPKQLTHIAIFRTGYPDSRKAIFYHQLQQQLRILAIGLLLLDALGLDLRGIADPHLKTQLGQQSFEPAGISSRLHPHSYVDSSQLQVSIELIGLPIAVIQSSFATFASLFHQKCDLLKAGVIIYAYQHVRLLPPNLWSSSNQSLLGSRESTLLCNQVPHQDSTFPVSAAGSDGRRNTCLE